MGLTIARVLLDKVTRIGVIAERALVKMKLRNPFPRIMSFQTTAESFTFHSVSGAVR